MCIKSKRFGAVFQMVLCGDRHLLNIQYPIFISSTIDDGCQRPIKKVKILMGLQMSAKELEERLNQMIDNIREPVGVVFQYAKLVGAVFFAIGVYGSPVFATAVLVYFLPPFWAITLIASVVFLGLGILIVLSWLILLCICVYG
jgi:hypothetical protein